MRREAVKLTSFLLHNRFAVSCMLIGACAIEVVLTASEVENIYLRVYMLYIPTFTINWKGT